ncbi:hypothetical protein COW36_23465 [bacterium (Candidatus Blackallbacteria) CG17_big_fil_post_rev_8_21_14_2_50_48_46]|uniref:Uncharacterized protein n=1 Tax=bacterium (Candidatus Blackallbacteria) CG17_big_fil_post_rev_8_21_14_2_50_48_46 TaxID=2014261 RepID=A0A2M7FXM4_9BACT|nr:MAG: hypothetical protein COW64_17675 [bacterium (Candidatus Blackallbacteria) CG18_big_fil_WC_8_21_14_2_50_49_26]PIW14001.1 MAG: hypothetical protein COW36_23465 [bacterium (Candidatus Blackallbacteria) CG17_big_fil_post_rev_8_21_14_2_50_48_46]PIW46852.1 MAG: hypothetical protein COW20_14640 [bacterium (Candidatus Blackallbacteria) CG13_big_fil_rev_8_21_14_2_50_49_14]
MTMQKQASSAGSTYSSQLFEPFQREIETTIRQSLHQGADLVIDALEQTSRIIKRGEELGQQINLLFHKFEEQHQDFRHTGKLLLKESIQDGVELCAELIQGIGQVARAALDETEEVAKRSEVLGGSVRETFQDLPNPFRSRTMRKPKGKEPTIIPISIQDN